MATDAALTTVGTSERRSVGEDVALHVVRAGDPDDETVCLLHGFPDFWYGWREQLQPLVAAGYHVLAPDLRGYNLSDAPQGMAAYRLSRLREDVAELLEDAPGDRAHVVGHDWGGGIAWALALERPDLLDRLAICNAPHPAAFRRALFSDVRQVFRSWYVGLFALPALPERLLSWRDYLVPARALERRGGTAAFTARDLDRYRASWRAGDLTAMLSYYRAMVRYREVPAGHEVAVPTLIVWGGRDRALGTALARESAGYCPDGRLAVLEDASHWVHMERPAAVNEELLAHLDGDGN